MTGAKFEILLSFIPNLQEQKKNQEQFSTYGTGDWMEKYLLALPRLEIDQDFFERAGSLRRAVYEQGYGISMIDVFIARSCIDAGVPLLTSDQDLQKLAKCCDLDAIGV